MQEERKRILEMVEAGKITADEAAELLATLEDVPETEAGEDCGEQAKSLKIRVEEAGEEKVNISLPLFLARSFVDFVPENARRKMQERGIEIESVLEQADVEDGTLVNIHDGDDHVEITLE